MFQAEQCLEIVMSADEGPSVISSCFSHIKNLSRNRGM